MNINLRRVYLYVASFIGLVMIIVGGVQLINLGLKAWIFTKADYVYYDVCVRTPKPIVDENVQGEEVDMISEEECLKREAEARTASRQNQASQAVATLLVGIPLYLYHWNKVRDEKNV